MVKVIMILVIIIFMALCGNGRRDTPVSPRRRARVRVVGLEPTVLLRRDRDLASCAAFLTEARARARDTFLKASLSKTSLFSLFRRRNSLQDSLSRTGS